MKLIKLQDKFILVSDEEIKEGDYFWYSTTNEILKCFSNKAVKSLGGRVLKYNTEKYLNNNLCKKIIAGISKLPAIDFSLLSEKDCLKIGFVDVEKLALDYANKNVEAPGYQMIFKHCFTDGFKTAQSLNDNKFSLEDIKLAWELGYAHGDIALPDALTAQIEFIQSLQQTSWDVKVEMEDNLIIKRESDYFNYDNGEKLNVKYGQPKITNNSIKLIKIL